MSLSAEENEIEGWCLRINKDTEPCDEAPIQFDWVSQLMGVDRQ